jgi:hypothetical protein
MKITVLTYGLWGDVQRFLLSARLKKSHSGHLDGNSNAFTAAGILHIMTPFIAADQSFWGSRVYAVGPGPKLVLVKNLTGGEPNACDG